MYQLGPEGGYRFVFTNVFARCQAWAEELNVSAILADYINDVIAIVELFKTTRVSANYQINGEFEPRVRSLIGPESFGMDRTDFQLVRITSDGRLEPGPGGAQVETEFELDVPEQQRFGNHILEFDKVGAADWLATTAFVDAARPIASE